MKMGKWKIGVIGVGGISVQHIQAYQNNPEAELYAFCDINESRLREMGEKYGVTRLYTDKDEMLRALPELDAVSVCTWNSAHAPCTIAALNAGKHVLCEKPMAVSAAQAEEMAEAARRNNRLLMMGFVRRYEQGTALLRELTEQGFFGDLYYAKATYLRRNGNPGGWFGDKSRSAGGPLIDLGVHVIDLTRYLMGNPKAVSVYGATFQKLLDRPDIRTPKAYRASSARPDDICDVEDLASAMIRFDNGAVLQVEAAFSLNLKEDTGGVQLFGSKGGARLSPGLELYSQMNGYMTDVTPVCPPESFAGEFQAEIDHFLHCISTGEPCRSPAQDGVEIMRILDAVYESARTGHEVILG